MSRWAVPGREPVPSASLRVLLALVRVYGRDGRATVRSVAAEAQRSISATHGRLVDLAERGLAAGVGEHGRKGALRPLLRAAPRVSARRTRQHARAA